MTKFCKLIRMRFRVFEKLFFEDRKKIEKQIIKNKK